MDVTIARKHLLKNRVQKMSWICGGGGQVPSVRCYKRTLMIEQKQFFSVLENCNNLKFQQRFDDW